MVEPISQNPVVRAVFAGSAPVPAQMAAARGILPLPPNDLLEVLVFLSTNPNPELSSIAKQTLKSQDAPTLRAAIASEEIAPSVLGFFAETEGLPKELHESVITNPRTPPVSIVNFVRNTRDGSLLERLSFNQQLLIQNSAILTAILENSFRTAEADRRASEIKREFFEKERGAQQIANELRAQGNEAAAEFIEQAEFTQASIEAEAAQELIDDAIFIASLIEVPDAEIDDTWLGLEYLEEIYEETDEQRQAIAQKIFGEMKLDGDEDANDRLSAIAKIMKLGMKDRVKLAMKGDREARTILIRDPNKIVAQAVVNNARITEQEVEKIASMRTVPGEILRLIASNRNWARNYTIMHTLARNPRTPIANAMTILTRLQTRDLMAISNNRNVSDAIRKQALRLGKARGGKG